MVLIAIIDLSSTQCWTYSTKAVHVWSDEFVDGTTEKRLNPLKDVINN